MFDSCTLVRTAYGAKFVGSLLRCDYNANDVSHLPGTDRRHTLSLTCKVLDNTLCVALDVLAHFGRCCLSGFGYNFMIATSQLCGPVSGVTFMFDYL